MKRTLRLDDLHFLSAALMIAAERYRENAATFRALIDHKPGPNDLMQISGDTARNFAEQFEQQAAQASGYCQLFDAITDDFEVEYDPELVEDDAEAA